MQSYSLKCYKCNAIQKDNSISRIYCQNGCNELLVCEDISEIKKNVLIIKTAVYAFIIVFIITIIVRLAG